VSKAIVVGSGPNGLAAALVLAAAGLEVTALEAEDVAGGGTRSVEATLPGLLHDECSGFHPLAVDNELSRTFDLAAHGLSFALPPVQYAHPLDEGRGAAAWRSVEETASHLGRDGRSWQRMFGPLAAEFDRVAQEFLQPMLHVPRAPLALARFGAYSGLPASLLTRRFRDDEARALFAGVAAHAFRPMSSLASSAIGTALGTAAHRYGWPVAVGGSASIGAALQSALVAYGGRVETGVRITSYDELDEADIVMLDTSPSAAAQIMGDRMPRRTANAYRRFQHGPGAFQIALAVHEGIPWTYEPARSAGTVHAVGDYAETARAEADLWRGRMPQRPYVLLGQQYLADPGRASGGLVPVDAYAHVPTGFTGDVTQAILDQIERFAPGTRERIAHITVHSTAALEARNANYVGGDIVTGANTLRQLLFRPRPALDPYSTGVDGVYLCSAATPPGAGAHGMCGWHAARSALRHLGATPVAAAASR
jgi:phytoene dehydrogenase-like protein